MDGVDTGVAVPKPFLSNGVPLRFGSIKGNVGQVVALVERIFFGGCENDGYIFFE